MNWPMSMSAPKMITGRAMSQTTRRFLAGASGWEVSVLGVSLIVVADYPQAGEEDINATHENS